MKQDELASLLGRHAARDGVHRTGIPRLSLIRYSRPTEPLHALQEPSVGIIVQGKKRVLWGEEVYTFDRNQYLVVSVDLPVVMQVVEADPETPYLCFRLDLDTAVLGELLTRAGPAATNGKASSPGLVLGPTDPELLDAAIRLVRLLDAPRDIGVVAPLVEREILYRLLVGDQSRTVRQISLSDGKLRQVSRAIHWIKEHFREPFSVGVIAREASMSHSALHNHFKEVTSMSPLQYQKRLRLQEARRLILDSSLDVAEAGFSVGYESPSQFSRDYRRLFGAPPLRETRTLKATLLDSRDHPERSATVQQTSM